MSLSRRTQLFLALATALSAFVGGLSIYQFSHISFLWFEVFLAILAVGLLTDLAWLFYGVGALCLCGLAAMIQPLLPPMTEKAAATADSATPSPTFRGPMVARPNSEIVFGGMHMGRSQIPIFASGTIPFQVHTGINGQLICDVQIYSLGTDAPIVMRNNVIENLPDGWDWNSNQNGIEIVNEEQKPMFQMYYDSPTVLRIQGAIVTPGSVYLADREGTRLIGLANPNLSDAIGAFSLPRFFKYPSAVFPGVPN